MTLASAILMGGFVAPWAACADMDIKETRDFITILADDKPILEYRQTCNPDKVYVSKLYTPSGLQILLDSPADHVHHHALMYALDSGENIWWTDGKGMGRQEPTGKTETRRQKKSAIISQSLNWNTSTGKTILKESRKITAHTGMDMPATLVSWHTVLSAADEGPVPLTTTREYVGLGVRFVREMDKVGSFIFPTGNNSAVVGPTVKVTADKWCACVSSIDDKPVTVAMFSAPPNLRHPTHWFTMTEPFAYISATLDLYRQPYTVKPGSPLNLTYGIAVFDGKRDTSTIERVYQNWLKRVRSATR